MLFYVFTLKIPTRSGFTYKHTVHTCIVWRFTTHKQNTPPMIHYTIIIIVSHISPYIGERNQLSAVVTSWVKIHSWNYILYTTEIWWNSWIWAISGFVFPHYFQSMLIFWHWVALQSILVDNSHLDLICGLNIKQKSEKKWIKKCYS